MVIKQINFIESTGKLILTEDNDTSYYCDIYGNKMKSFLPQITGQSNSYIKRFEKFPDQAGENISNLSRLHKFPNSHNLYLPVINKFEGYSKFPQPLSPPLYNLSETHEMGRENRRKLIKTLKKHFTNKKVLNQFSLSERKEDNNHLTYMMTPIRFCYEYNNNEADKVSLIKLIDEHFEEYKKEHKFNADQIDKDPIIKALKRFCKLLEENKNVNVEKKMNLIRPNENILEKYKIIQNKLRKNYVHKKMNIKDISEKIVLNRNYLKEKFLKNSVNINDNENSFNSTSSTEDKKLQEEHFICFNLKKSTNINLKSKEFLRNSLEIEKEYIEGYKEIPLREEGIFRKNPNAKFKSEGDFYPETMKLLNQVNPRTFEYLKKKEDYQFKEMVKKRKQKYIFQQNSEY